VFSQLVIGSQFERVLFELEHSCSTYSVPAPRIRSPRDSRPWA
jgi:hypothetical protein